MNAVPQTPELQLQAASAANDGRELNGGKPLHPKQALIRAQTIKLAEHSVGVEKMPRLFPAILDDGGELITPARPIDWSSVDMQVLPRANQGTNAGGELLPVEKFNPGLMPEALRAWVLDIAHRMQCPPDFTAVAAITALSSLVGARAVIQPKRKDNWKVVPNLWGLAIGRPGVMKSPAIAQALAPLHRLEKDERENHEQALKAWEVEYKFAQIMSKQLESDAAKIGATDKDAALALLTKAQDATPEKPIARRFIANDATVEKLGEMLENNLFGILAYRDEMYGLIQSMGKKGQEGARGFYLTSYEGNSSYAVDRIGRGERFIRNVCISMLGSIQPDRMKGLVNAALGSGDSEHADDGLLQRFALTVWPDVDQDFTYVNQWPDTPASQAAWAVYERLSLLMPMSETEVEPIVWRFDDEAQELFRTWMTDFETEIRGDDLHTALVSHLAKYRKLVPALALIFALIDAQPGDEQRKVVAAEHLQRALAWARYLRTHAERMYGLGTGAGKVSAVEQLDKWLIEKCRADSTDAGAVSRNETLKFVPVRSLRNSAGLDAALSVLVEAGRARQHMVGKKMMIAVNPALLAGAEQQKEDAA